ncbi:MAG TPA: DUF1266 domain-containing protein [Gordonia sp. (in: high G+C Gram-positive bacteria)]|uniref:DUF1266 domain-containing protein n=1 Tax=unclassified Gordonia (in: high G+C Gram-positive bacteria) TaxID=2657482 RepID=UPI000FBEFEB3|nr:MULTISPECIES: DUF1266 domain-containing protein [unclassified Gordonia (in: high G+C Gram-positive bacteria)]RUP41212.1 MAG: DUF1266 domain-containing protein [Gordonia sp. (in: high G+C Gram-positive bacteria)]HNP55593.1 DUF1266 domain-containing protein [Gordonia sp. (in: high G+C Gram-positive bacteria)]HRC50494.1 DUF1266 domain-containing protein [Gordonia sp. (in: high G+C Gram-positive bacteria)]
MTDDEGTPDQPNPNGPDKRPDDLSADELAAAFHRRSDSGAADWMRPREGRRANATLLAHADKQVPADPDGPLYGPLAQGLALGALRALSTPDLWNTLSAIGSDGAARRGLLTAWGIENTDDWFTTMTSLIGLTEFIETESMLDARAVSIARGGYSPSQFEEVWHDWLADHDYDDEAYEATQDRLAAITAVDEILCDSGLLAPGGHVGSIGGYSLTWAVYLARLGATAGYSTEAQAAQMILSARDRAAQIFASWTEFAVSSVGGALLHEDITGFVQLRRIAATLLTVDHSPWRALPFPVGDIG